MFMFGSDSGLGSRVVKAERLEVVVEDTVEMVD